MNPLDSADETFPDLPIFGQEEREGTKIGPWVRLDQTVPYRNSWIQVEHHEVRDPSGSQGIYGVVRFKHRALGCIPLHEDGTVTLVGQHRYPLDRYFWEIPEGGGRAGHDPLEEMKRELLEETGLVASTWLPLGEVHLSNSVTDEMGMLWLAKDLVQGTASPEPVEKLQLQRIPFREAVEQAADGRITDALSVVALLRAARLVD